MTRQGFKRLAAQKLRDVRKLHGRTQIQMAKTMGISQATLSKIETGEVEPSLFAWLRFCREYGVDPALGGNK